MTPAARPMFRNCSWQVGLVAKLSLIDAGRPMSPVRNSGAYPDAANCYGWKRTSWGLIKDKTMKKGFPWAWACAAAYSMNAIAPSFPSTTLPISSCLYCEVGSNGVSVVSVLRRVLCSSALSFCLQMVANYWARLYLHSILV